MDIDLKRLERQAQNRLCDLLASAGWSRDNSIKHTYYVELTNEVMGSLSVNSSLRPEHADIMFFPAVSVGHKQVYELTGIFRGAPRGGHALGTIGTGIADLVPRDCWKAQPYRWTITRKQSAEQVTSLIFADIIEYAIPYIDRLSSLDAILIELERLLPPESQDFLKKETLAVGYGIAQRYVDLRRVLRELSLNPQAGQGSRWQVFIDDCGAYFSLD